MKVKEYIGNLINRINENFFVSIIKYEHSKVSNGHIVLVNPSALFFDATFSEFIYKAVQKFEQLFPNEYLFFIENEDLVQLNYPEISIDKTSYQKFTSVLVDSNVLVWALADQKGNFHTSSICYFNNSYVDVTKFLMLAVSPTYPSIPVRININQNQDISPIINPRLLSTSRQSFKCALK